MSTKMKFPMKKLALGVSSAIVVLGAQPASADAILFPYVVNGGSVTTILSAVTTAPIFSGDFRFADTLHYAYNYKTPAAASDPTPWNEPCDELNFYNPSSIGDIVTFNIGAVMNVAANGVLFESNPFTPPFDPSKKVIYPENFGQFPAGHRGYVTVDNNDPLVSGGASDSTLYGEALILDFTSGAAWGYRAYNPAGTSPQLALFYNGLDALGEVLSNLAPPNIVPTEAAAVELYPGSQFTQKALITPIPDPLDVTPGGPTPMSAASGVIQPEVVARVSVGPQFQSGFFASNSLYDRDENPTSGRFDIPVVCVGAPDFTEFFTAASLTKYNGQGGWTTLSSLRTPTTDSADLPFYTGDMVAMKLTYTAGPIEGVAIGGTLNSALWLQSTRIPPATGTVGTNNFGYVWGTPPVSPP